MLKLEELQAKLSDIESVVSQWESSTVEPVRWRGRQLKAISEPLVEAWESLFDACDTMDVDFDAKPVVMAVDAFEEQVKLWAEANAMAPDEPGANPSGPVALWRAYEAIHAKVIEVRNYVPTKCEDIVTLKEIDMLGHSQIARMYGWLHPDGSPDLRKVAEEIENPGTHYDPETWRHEVDIEREERINTEFAKRSTRVTGNQEIVQREAPETVGELVQQGVPSAQIMRMKPGVTMDEIKAIAIGLAVPLDGAFVRAPAMNPTDKAADRRADESEKDAKIRAKMLEQKSHPEIKDQTERILTCFVEESMSQAEIADALQFDYPGLTRQKVVAIIRKSEEESATAK